MAKRKIDMEKQKKWSANYDKANTKMVHVKVNKNTEPDIYEKLESVKNMSGYIKELIRNDIHYGRQD